MKTFWMEIATLSALVLVLTSPVAASDPHWDHTVVSQEPGQGSDGTFWATLKGDSTKNSAAFEFPFAECAIGSHQSPIAINLTPSSRPLIKNPFTNSDDINPSAEPERRADSLMVRYTPSISSTDAKNIGQDDGNHYIFRNTGHAVQVSFSKGYPGRLVIGKDVYPLVQFHFHTGKSDEGSEFVPGSEHVVIKGAYSTLQQYAGELHFVHQREDGKLAVLGIFLDGQKSAAENPILTNIIQYTPQTAGSNNTTGGGLPLDPSKLIPANNEYVFTYAGSLTTPPCSEGVSWFVMSEPLRVASSQIEALSKFLALKNNRIVQNTNSRTVEIRKDLHVTQP